MKTIKTCILAVVLVALSQCKKDSQEPYSNENIVMDNAQAALFFHTVFREAEYAWAFIHRQKYEEKTYTDSASTATVYKKLTYEPYKNIETKKNMVTIEYHEWESNGLLLRGNIFVVFDNDSSYRKDGKLANVELKDFSINGQNVVGEATLKYRKAASNPDTSKDQYTYTLLNGAAIYGKDYSKKVLVTSAISNGQYERTEGYKTLTQDDDVWVYVSGEMKGTLHDDPKLKYTNTVTATYMNKDAKVYYTMDCKPASQGFSIIKITGRPDIVYWYRCDQIFFGSVTLHLR